MKKQQESKPEPKVHIPIDQLHAVRMSNRQFGQLKYLLSAPKATIHVDEISHLNQLTLGGNKRREWVTETAGKDGITITHEGREAVKAFENGDFLRKVSSMRFSSFLSLDVYDGTAEEKSKKALAAEKKPKRRKSGQNVRGLVTAIRSRPKVA